jgi:hypothetical protein
MTPDPEFPLRRPVLDQEQPGDARDRDRLRLGRALMQPDNGPVVSPLQGLAKAATQMVGAWQARRAMDNLDERQRAMTDQLVQALSPQWTPDPKVAGPRIGTGTRIDPTPEGVGQALTGSEFPELQRLGARLRLDAIGGEAAQRSPADMMRLLAGRFGGGDGY